jgi:hypothetical protein
MNRNCEIDESYLRPEGGQIFTLTDFGDELFLTLVRIVAMAVVLPVSNGSHALANLIHEPIMNLEVGFDPDKAFISYETT